LSVDISYSENFKMYRQIYHFIINPQPYRTRIFLVIMLKFVTLGTV